MTRTETNDEVCLITLDRPERLNAWTPAMADEIATVIAEANANPDIGTRHDQPGRSSGLLAIHGQPWAIATALTLHDTARASRSRTIDDLFGTE